MALKAIPDYRVDTGKIEYPLDEVLFMTLFAIIKGNTTFKDIYSWMMYNENNELKVIKTSLQCNGDFRSPECVKLLKECDIVATNPPFSLFREFVDLLVEYDKKFVIIGNMNALTYKNVFPLIKEDRLCWDTLPQKNL